MAIAGFLVPCGQCYGYMNSLWLFNKKMIKFYNQEETPVETPETPAETPTEEMPAEKGEPAAE